MLEEKANRSVLSLSKCYYLVVNDRFELFFRGIVKMHNPYQYYIKASCIKGYSYNRYFTYTPTLEDVGTYPLKISLINDFGEVIEEQTTTLIVENPKSINKKINVLCIGDSITSNGVWPYTGFTRYNEIFKDKLNFIGTCRKEEIGFEGYGGWQWKTFCEDNNNSRTSSVWITSNHDKDDSDQHSVWLNNGNQWVLETITKNKLKFKRGEFNNAVNPQIKGAFTHLHHGTNYNDIIVSDYEYSEGNPFWNSQINDIDFKYYAKNNKIDSIDLVFILLTWNGQYLPYNTDFTIHDTFSSKIINKIHEDYPNAKIGVLGIQLPCPNGGITACYGASGYYHDWYGETITAFNYNEFLEKKCLSKDYLKYCDTKAQFDSEYNYYVSLQKVNNRNDEVTERIGVNGIHPSNNGYLQLGDIFYRFLVYMLNNFY